MIEYRMSRLVRRYYSVWLKGGTLLAHPEDARRFYCFVKACLRYSRLPVTRLWLRHFLERDLSRRYRRVDRNLWEDELESAVSLFYHLVTFAHTRFPCYWLHTDDPDSVWLTLRSARRQDGQPQYSKQEMEAMMVARFGPDWRLPRDARRRRHP